MEVHLHREIEKVKTKLLNLATEVEETLSKTILSFREGDIALAQTVVDNDDLIDFMEVEIEEDCLKILALHQPVAVDLRFVIAVIKITNSLERIADNIANMASRIIQLDSQETFPIPIRFNRSVELAQQMLHQSLDALINLDTTLARTVITTDDTVDALHRAAYGYVIENIQRNPTKTDQQINFLSISRQIERICDLATNIAEDTIYMIEGEIVRHREV